MQTRSIVLASLLHGAVIVGVGLGMQPWRVQPRPEVQVALQQPAPEIQVPEEAVLVEDVPPPAEMADEPFVEPEFTPPPPAPDPNAERPDEPRELVEREPVDSVEPPSRRFRAPRELLVRMRKVVAVPAPAAPSAAASFVEAAELAEENEPPAYPERARRRGVEGTVVLLVTVGVDGAVRKVDIQQSAGLTRLHRELDRAAIAAICTWRYTPARRDGVAVEAKIKVPVEFRLR